MYIVHCTVSIEDVLTLLYIVHRVFLHRVNTDVQCTLKSVHCTVYILQGTQSSLYRVNTVVHGGGRSETKYICIYFYYNAHDDYNIFGLLKCVYTYRAQGRVNKP